MASAERKIKTKVVLLGDVSVGKTSLGHRFQKDEMPANVTSTLGAQFLTVTFAEAGTELQFDIWDTAGQERFRSLGALYYKSARGAIVVFDLTSEKSFLRAKEWVAELHQNAEPDIVISLVGNKNDLESQRQVKREEAEAYANSQGLLYFEASAMTGNNVKQIFMETMRKIPVAPSKDGGRGLGTKTENADSSQCSRC